MVSNRWLRVLSSFLSLTVIFTCVPNIVRADSGSISYYSVTEGLQYEVNSSVVSAWDTHANLEFVITNTGNETIHNWYFTFDLPYAIEGIWNASVFDAGTGNLYTIKNSGSNQDILPGSSVSFGMTVASLNGNAVESLPTFYLLNTSEKTVDTSCYFVTYQEYSNWGTGFNGALILSNLSSENIEDWKMSFSSNRGIVEVSGVDFNVNGNGYEIGNNGSNQNIVTGSNLNMTIIGNGQNTGEGLVITDVTLYTIGCVFGLSDDNDLNGTPDYIDFINSQNGDPDITPTSTPSVTVTPETTLTPEITVAPTPTSLEEDFSDTDGDGLLDSEESMIGTDPNDSDTDHDGITDFIEITMGYNPRVIDSDNDGISDGDKDFDLDGINNATEIELGTCPFFSDSDDDGINDHDELYVYETDPLNEDSDGDGIIDGNELLLNKNPNNPSDKYLTILQNKDKQIGNEIESVYVEIGLTDYIESALSIGDMLGKDVYTTDLVGRVGSPIEFDCKEDFDTASIIFYYDETKLGDTQEEDLGILWYDEEHGVYILQEQAVLDTTNNTITLEVDHFSTYVMVDKLIWENIPGIQYVFPTDQYHFDYYVAINVSTSMDSQARNNAVTAVENLMSSMNDQDRICIIYFDTGYATNAQLISKTNTAGMSEALNQVRQNLTSGASNGGSYGSYRIAFVITEAIINRVATDVGNYRTLFILSNDDDMIYAGNYLSDMLYCMESGDFTANFVMLQDGNEGTWEYGWQYAAGTGSDYYKYPSFDSLHEDFTNKYAYRCAWSVDGDHDEIPDLFEQQGIIGTNGRIYYSDPNNGDSDGDAVPDGDELSITYELSRSGDGRSIFVKIDGTIVYSNNYGSIESSSDYYFLRDYMNKVGPGKSMTFVVLASNPNIADTDSDGANDAEDARPLTENPERIYILAGPDFYGQGLALQKNYRSKGWDSLITDFSDVISFENAWDKIGLYEDETNNYGGKYYYQIKAVVISCHGSQDCLFSGVYTTGKETAPNIAVSDLSPKPFSDLYLYACSCGMKEKSDSYNIAEDFLNQFDSLNRVYAFDTTIWGCETKNGESFSYYGWSYNRIEIESDYDSFMNLFDDDDIHGGLIDFNDNSNIWGFRKFYKTGSGISSENVYIDDIRLGVLHIYIGLDNDNNPIEMYYLVYISYDGYDYNNVHDPLFDEK